MDNPQAAYPPPPSAEPAPPMPPTPAEQQQQQQQPVPTIGGGSDTTYYPPPPPAQPAQTKRPYNPQDYADQPMNQQTLFPPSDPCKAGRYSEEFDVSSPAHYSRDPKKLIAYLVPFPKPRLANMSPESIPQRYLIYTPPPPPFVDKPKEGEKEGRVHKVQRKWQDEIREAKTGNAKTASWEGLKSKAIRGINWGMSATKSSNLEFLNRIGGSQEQEHDAPAEDGHKEGEDTKATVKLEQMLLIYPSSMSASPDQIREEFINTMLRSKSKAERDAILATGLLPVSAAIDIMLTLVWPFGGLLEIDAVWAYSSIRGAKASRSVTKRLTSTSTSGKHDQDKLHLEFTPSPRLAVLEKYLAARCHDRSPDLFPYAGNAPPETEALEAIGWFPSSKGGTERNWEDEQWEISEVKDDLQNVMKKGAREWDKWVKLYEKKPEKALKK